MNLTTNELDGERELRLRSLQLQQITAATLLQIAAALNEILKLLREQSRHRNAITLDDWFRNGWRQS
jgi:hypothetical protein